MIVGEVTSRIEVSPLGLRRLYIRWMSDANGDASAWLKGEERVYAVGGVERAVTRPSVGAAPSANYDIAFEDPRGEEILNINNCSATEPETWWPIQLIGTLSYIDKTNYGTVKFIVSDAGANKAGELHLYINPQMVARFE